MPLNIPSRATLQQQILADMQARIAGADTTLRRSTLGVLAYVWAGALWLAYRFIVGLSRELFIWSCTADYLDRKVGVFGITREGASAAAGTATFTGTPGLLVPNGTVVQTTDASVQFITQADGTIAGGGTVTVAIEASTAGSAGNLIVGAPLNLTTAIAGIQPVAAVAGAGLSGGADAESDASLRARGLTRIQQPPQGGASTDYVAWTKQVAGVTRVWVYPLNRGPGTVDVIFTLDGRGVGNNLPLSADITAVQALLAVAAPVTAEVAVYAPTADTLTVTVINLAPNTPAMVAAITANLNALALTVPPGGATMGDGVSSAAPGGTLLLEQIYAAISAAGPTAFDLTAPVADVTFASQHMPGAWTISIT